MRNQRKTGHHRPGEEDYLLTGKLRCGHCGGYMIGMSGTSGSGIVHHYYACQNRRVGRTCDKKNIRRDIIEPAVAKAIKQYCLTDDVIEWIADKTIEYWEDEDRKLQIASLENELADVNSSISNVMKAIEQGVVTSSTRDRLIELEAQQSDLSAKLTMAKDDLVQVDRKDLIAGLLLFRNGDIYDRKYQEDLFNTFLVAAYVYDDGNRLKLVFNCFGDSNTVDLTLGSDENNDNSNISSKADYGNLFAKTLRPSTRMCKADAVPARWLVSCPSYFLSQQASRKIPEPLHGVRRFRDLSIFSNTRFL